MRYFSCLILILLSPVLALAETLQSFPQASAALPEYANAKENFAPLPIPNTEDPTELSLTNAVLLALRRNPNLKMDFNNRKLSQFDLLVAQQALRPQVTLEGSYQWTKNDNGSTSNNNYVLKETSFGPNVSWLLPLGTQIDANYSYNPTSQTGDNAADTSNTGWGITITQPLLRGFGLAVNEADLHNAEDQQIIDNYTLANQVIDTITQITTDYYGVVEAEQTQAVDQAALVSSQKTLDNRRALFNAGRIAHADVVQAQLDLSSKQTIAAQDAQKVMTARITLLNDLDLDPDTNFHVVKTVPISHITPNLQGSISQAVRNNLDLKIAELQFSQAKRNILVSDNNQLWKVNAIFSKNHSNYSITTTTPPNVTRTVQNDTSAELSLEIPLDRVSINQSRLKSAITLGNAQITLRTAKTQLLNNVTSSVENLQSQWAQLLADEANYKLALQNNEAAQIKYQYGKIDAFSLSQQQQQLQQSANTLINDRISYLEQVITYEKLVGTLLPQWHIHLQGIENATSA